MNRSLEALAIFSICLGGILAAVRISAQQRPVSGEVAGVKASAPAKNSGSAVERTPAVVADSTIADCELAYAAGCGFDRNEQFVYSPCTPLLSPREVALLAIRSEPIPLIVLPEESETATGYDAAYDAAMETVLAPLEVVNELTRTAVEAEYAAAELATAGESAGPGTFENLHVSELSPSSPTWQLILFGLTNVRSEVTDRAVWLQQSYLQPLARGVENRMSQLPLPRWPHPRARAEAQQQMLLKKRAENPAGPVSWEDYVGFTARNLPVKVEKEPESRLSGHRSRNLLWPR